MLRPQRGVSQKKIKYLTLPCIFCPGGGLQFECYPLPSLQTKLLMADGQHFGVSQTLLVFVVHLY
jgi:hypothetical protein